MCQEYIKARRFKQDKEIEKKTGRLIQCSLSKRKKMATEQSMAQATTHAANEGIKAELATVREVGNPVNNARIIHTIPRSSTPMPRQPTFEWKPLDKFQELCTFEMEKKNIL